ncbi:MAG: hypothetical protein RLZ19_875 [Actinomycetota bacterium]
MIAVCASLLGACGGNAAEGSTVPAVTLSPSTVATTTSLTSTTSTTTTTTTTVVPTTSTTITATTTTAPEVSVLAAPLPAVGSRDGMGTALIQQRLLELGFWLYGVDGEYGSTTKQAVMAFQKWTGLDPTGSVNQVTADALTSATARPVGQSTSSNVVVEIDKTKQVMLITAGGKLVWAINISTGSGQYYLEKNQKDPTKWETGRSLTHSGKFKVQRERADGWWDGDLGKIYRPKYFNGGIAIHGSKSIPNYPASHGCVRVSVAAMDMIWASGLIPLKTAVWVYGEDVEAEGEPPVIPTTTTTVVPESTVAPETTVAPGSTVPLVAPSPTPPPTT